MVQVKQGNPADRFMSDLNRAMALHRENRLAEAEAAYRQLLRQQPGHFDVVHLLGTLLRRTGKQDESLALLDRAVALRPESAAAHLNRGNLLVDRKAYAAAVESFARAIALKGDSAEAFHGRSAANLLLGRLDAAKSDAETALRLNPRLLDAALTLASVFLAMNRADEAGQICLRLVSFRPDWPDALLKLGLVFQALNQLDKAVDAFGRAGKLAGGRTDIKFRLAAALSEQERNHKAMEVIDEALALAPGLAEFHVLKGDVLSKLEQPEAAESCYGRALALDPASAQAHSSRGRVLAELGRRPEAATSYESALALDPALAGAHLGLSSLRRYAAGDPHIATMQRVLGTAPLTDIGRCEISFALAKALEDSGDLAASFDVLRRANALRKAVLGYRPEDDVELFAKLTAAAPGLLRAAPEASGGTPAGPVPIFILGMPRSGTTLVEQILSAGPDVHGAGELTFIETFGTGLATGAAPVSPEALRAFADAYLADLARHAAGRPYVTDKMPHNFRFLPLISAAFPQAKILHIKRDARAICWSNYKHNFAQRGLGYSYDLADIVNFYRLYETMMARWQKLCPGRITTVDYDRLAAAPEPETRQLIAALGLPWHDAYLSPQSNERRVHTASLQQVREAVYSGSSQAWKSFAPFIGDAFDGLPQPENPD